MNIKKLLLVVAIAVVALSSCENEIVRNDLDNEEKICNLNELDNEIYDDVNNFIVTWNDSSLIRITEFMKSSTITTRKTTSCLDTDMDLESLRERIDNGTFYHEILTDQQVGFEYLSKLASAAFMGYFNQIYYVSDREGLIRELLKDEGLDSYEKAFLMLYVASYEKDLVGSDMRSVKSCIKRFAKLTTIVAGALVDSFMGGGPSEAAQNASDNLKNMGPEYDC